MRSLSHTQVLRRYLPAAPKPRTRHLIMFYSIQRTLLVVAVCLLSACGSDTISNVVPDTVDNPPDNTTGAISFSQNVLPIFQASCSGSGCHINNTQSGVNLTSFNSIRASSGAQYGGLVVVPGNAAGSPLINKIESSSPLFGQRMPRGRSPLSSPNIATIKTWINDGAINN